MFELLKDFFPGGCYLFRISSPVAANVNRDFMSRREETKGDVE